MKYRHKMKLQEAAKVKGQKRRVADRSEKPQYTDEEVAKLVDYDYGCLLDMIYYKLESMRDFFLSKHTHCKANGSGHAAHQHCPRQGGFL